MSTYQILHFRLFESHKKMQRVNHNLEDKLLKIVRAMHKFDLFQRNKLLISHNVKAALELKINGQVIIISEM